MKKLLFILLWLLLLGFSSGYTIVDNNVIYENDYAKLNVYPYLARPESPLGGSLTQTFVATKKVGGTHDLYFGYKFSFPLQSGKMFELVNGNWINRTQYMLSQEFQGNYYYFTEIPVSFTDAQPERIWKIEYTPNANDSTNKWDLIAWKAENRDDIFEGNETFKVILDPWWGTGYGTKQALQIPSAHENIDANSTLWVNFDTAALVSAGTMQSDCNDLRITYTESLELDRFIEGCNQTDTNVYFRSQAALNDGVADSTSYHIYYENSAATIGPDKNHNIFWQYDDFNGTNGDDWNNMQWSNINYIQGSTCSKSIQSNRGEYVCNSDATAPESWVDLNALVFDLDKTVYARYNLVSFVDTGFTEKRYGGGWDARGYVNKNHGSMLSIAVDDAGGGANDGTLWNVIQKDSTDLTLSNDLIELYMKRTGATTGDLNATLNNTREYNEASVSNFSDTNHFSIAVAGSGGTVKTLTATIDDLVIMQFDPTLAITLASSESLPSRLKLIFRDENSNALINPTTVNISINDGDQNNWTSNVANGILDINLANYASGKWIITYNDATRKTRTFMYDLNNLASYEFILGMLADPNGNTINFTFYKQNGITLLTDANIEVRDSQDRIAGRTTTNNSGEISFYLNPNDGNYSFNINDSNGSDYNYSATTVTIRQPLNEIDLTSAGNFRIRTSGVASYDLNNLSSDTNILLFNNTDDYHIIKISNVDSNYFDRHYYLKFLGETEFYDLQPYLLTGTDGTLTTITAKDSFTYETIPDVLITVRKLIAGQSAPIIVERINTDIVGTGTFVFAFNDEYLVDINYGTLFETVNLTPVKTAYDVFISSAESTTDVNTLASYTDINWLQTGLLTEGTGGYDINFIITSLDDLNYLDVNMENPIGTNIYSVRIDLNDLHSYTFGYTIPTANINDANSPIKVLYTIKYTNSPAIESMKHFNIAQAMHYIYTTGFRDLWNDLGQPGTLFIVTLLGVFLTGITGRFILKNQEYVLILAATIMAAFVYLGAIDVMAWTIATVLSFFVLIGRRGLNV